MNLVHETYILTQMILQFITSVSGTMSATCHHVKNCQKSNEIIYNVAQFFEISCKSKNHLELTSEATKVNRNTISKIKSKLARSGSLEPPKRTKVEKITVDSFDKDVIRRKIHEIYVFEKRVPTIQSLHAVLVRDINFYGSLTYLRKLLKSMGFRWKKCSDNRKALMEKTEIVSLRGTYLRRIKRYREEGKDIVYLDETWVDTACTVKKCWQSSDYPGVVVPNNKGQRLIVVHAGSANGFVPGAKLIYKASRSTGDYHHEMNGDNFEKWLREKLLQNLTRASVIVMDNASYHSVQSRKCPSSSTRKAEMQQWLRDHGVAFTDDMNRCELLHLVRLNKPREPEYVMDKIVQDAGHNVLRLPPYHCDLNPIGKTSKVRDQKRNVVRK